MEEGWSWSLRRWKMYNDCPRQYYYHYFQSKRRYHEDDNGFEQRLYDLKNNTSHQEAHYNATSVALVESLFQGSKNSLVNQAYHSAFIQQIPFCNDQKKASFFQRFAQNCQSLLKDQCFQWMKVKESDICE